jgi:glycosyltransferase involved in cell wall biosynthesis
MSTLCLNMIVKNESHILATTLAHLCEHFTFSYWVICDTGSTDGTQEIIRDFFKQKGIPGELTEESWRDFGYNRTVALNQAYNKSDYVLIWDADDSFQGKLILPATLTYDSYRFSFGGYFRPQLVNNRRRWKYVGVLHEYLTQCDGEISTTNVGGSYQCISGRTGARNKDSEKYLKDALVLEKGLVEEPTNGRYAFYCANSYRDAKKPEKAIEMYKRTLEIKSWSEELYLSCVRIYECLLGLGREVEGLGYLVEAHKYSTHRIEHILPLVRYYSSQKMYNMSITYYTTLAQKTYEAFGTDRSKYDNCLFIQWNDNLFYFPYQVIIPALHAGQHDIAHTMFKTIWRTKVLTPGDWYLNNLFSNLAFLKVADPDLETLQDMLEYCQALRDRGFQFTDQHNKNIAVYIDAHKSILIAPQKNPMQLLRSVVKPRVVLTITTCKRLDLFEQTMNSIIHTWTDLNMVDYFFCVDDNSSAEDRAHMKELYPFFDFYMKGPEERGHRESMNIIWQRLKELQPTYWIHMEDDWLFFRRDAYVAKSIDFLDKYENQQIHQVLFNRNYTELYSDWDIQGGAALEPGFTVHVKDMACTGRNSAYWPHYSFRPSMVRTSAVLSLENYNSPNTFFERDYANRWNFAGYRSSFFDTISAKHIGKLTRDKTGQNAYTLNDVSQFGGNSSPEWVFIPGLDSTGGDICYDKNNTKSRASQNPNYIAYNTLGYIKDIVNFPLKPSPYFSSTDGIYIRKDYKPIRIKPLCGKCSPWRSSEEICKDWNRLTKGNYRWNHIQLTWGDDNIDYYVIINAPPPNVYYDPTRTLVFQIEPWCADPKQRWGVKTWGEWAKPDPSKFLYVHDKETQYNIAFWQFGLSYTQIRSMTWPKRDDDTIASICSSKYFDPGHIKRIDFMKFIEAKSDPDVQLHIYNMDNAHNFKSYKGKADANIDKEKGIAPYKYYFMCENNEEKNFITEKLWEPILCETLCFYWGCPNVAEWINPQAFIWLDMNDFEGAFQTVKRAIKEDWWSQRLPYIRKEKDKILDYYNFMPTIERILKEKGQY